MLLQTRSFVSRFPSRYFKQALQERQISTIKMGLTGNEELREFMDKLAVSNVSRHIELPMIAVMGDTSSGKSSLLTSISMVELPSSEKLTTRCPIMLQMKRAETRTAEVSVKWKDISDASADSDFLQLVDESTWPELTGHIADAQDHIMKITAKTGANDVAPDIVQVRVTGPDCEDLTLIDLPGIVRSTGAGESATLVQDIQCLIDDYLTNSRCVILAVHPANVDFHNSQIMADAKKVDPETKRTLPVITKPDLIDSGAEEGVKELLLGRKTDKFEKGFHMVKGRGQKALNGKQTIEESLQMEEAFFQNALPWRNVDNRRLFGTKALRVKLGELQIQLVRDTFPDIKKDMETKKEKAEDELAILGEMCETMSDKRRLYYDLSRRIVEEIDERVQGKPKRLSRKKKQSSPAATFHKLSTEFCQNIAKGRLSGVSDPVEGDRVVAAFGLEELQGKLTMSEDLELIVQWDDGLERSVSFSKLRRSSDWIQARLLDNRSLDLPIFPNQVVFNDIVSDFIEEDWESNCFILLDEVVEQLRGTVKEVVSSEKRLERYPRLFVFLRDRLEQILNQSFREAQEDLRHYISKEKKPYTQNDYLSETISRLRSKPLEDAVYEALGLASKTTFDREESLHKSQIKTAINAIFNHNRKKSLDLHMAEEMQYSLDAYGKVAFKRFADEVPKISKEVLDNFARKAHDSLSVLPDEKQLDGLICENMNNKLRYEYLRQKVEDLEEGLKIIEGLTF
jgi:hypothetical protein